MRALTSRLIFLAGVEWWCLRMNKQAIPPLWKHPYVAMDTEFPGVVARPYGTFRSHTDYQYQTLKVLPPLSVSV